MRRNSEEFLEKIKRIPLILPSFISLLCIYGFVLLYSAAGGSIEPWAQKQVIAFCIFMPISLLIALVDLRVIYQLSYLFYFITLAMLIIVEFMGKSAMGATRWLNLGLITIQPSELVKISLVLMLAKYFHRSSKYNIPEYNLLIPIIATFVPIALVIKQPDLGTGMITLMVAVVIFFAAGKKIIYFIVSGILCVIALPIFWYMLHDYQKSRILTFINPERDPLGAGYNIIQSKIAIGSGGLFGKGLLSGTQGHLSFLPEYQTDFIFAFLAEEFGFAGGIVLLIMYAVLIVNCLFIALNCKSEFATLVTIGITTLFFAHIFINIAMVMGMLPVVGVPLPLLSYGRTMMGSILIGFGLIMNMSVNRYRNV
jgi:rod shape determining protein RodA